ncbi:MAG: cyclic nucleotide-binding domain-containing protein [Deltaproteobacteria bacterium]|nr:cyclic nucleotide-binding domain-containing protein [Deltaproteobacteria bacterium]MBW2136812.1 cyclic nucleotide-binding domain-containing protein [Deltaproteobacteria bacterium]
MEREELLRKVTLFSVLKDSDIKSLADFCAERSFREGQTLVQQGEPGVGLYIIKTGKVKIVKKTASGQDLEIAILGPGEFFGEMSVLDDAPRSASVAALEDTRCLFLTAWDFKARMKVHPEIALQILPVVVQRFRETNERLLALSAL